MPIRLLGGGLTLNTLISDMNTNLLSMRAIETSVTGLSTVKEGTATGTAVVGSTVNIDVVHGLGYLPSYAEVTYLGSKLPLMLDVSVGTPLAIQTYFSYVPDSTKLRITMTLSASSTYAGSRSFYYKLYR